MQAHDPTRCGCHDLYRLEADSYIEEERKRYCTIAQYEFPLRPQPKERAHNFSKIRTRSFEDVVKALAGELAEQQLKASVETRLAVSIAFVVKEEQRGDLDNMLKSILDGMNRKAFWDDRRIRLCHVTEAVRPDEDERIIVQLLERVR